MAKTLEQQLADVEAAISNAETAQRWQQGNRSEERPELAGLYQRRDHLAARIARQTSGGIRARQGVPLG